MFNRRYIRIKVMQALYSRALDNQASSGYLLKNIDKTLHDVWKLYLIQLQTIEQLANYTQEYRNFQESKFIKPEQLISTKITLHHFIQGISLSETFAELTEDEKIQNVIPTSVIKATFKQLLEKDFFIAFNDNEDASLDNPKLITNIFKKVLLKSDVYTSVLEEKFISWSDDSQLIIKATLKTIKQFFEKGEPYITYVLQKPDWDEAEKFTRKLFLKTIENEEYFESLVKPILKNWDASRLNVTDQLLIYLAIAEFLFFEEIPVKVSINEYIEISKMYSTPKSNEFVNGVLDTLLKQLNSQNKIKKSGRGLIN